MSQKLVCRGCLGCVATCQMLGVANLSIIGRKLTKSACFRPGELSGESDGNDSRVFAESGVTKVCLREPARTVPDLREAVESCEADLSSLSLLLLEVAMLNLDALKAGKRCAASVKEPQARTATLCGQSLEFCHLVNRGE